MRGITAIRHDPQRQSGETVQQTRRHRQFMGLSGGQSQADCPAGAVRYDTGLGGEAPARAAKRFTRIALR